MQEGDGIFIPAGTFHAIGEGLVLCEVQQNSDLTFRVYDWERKDDDGNARPLHIKEALEAGNLSMPGETITPKTVLNKNNSYLEYLLADCPYFQVRQYAVKDSIYLDTGGEIFHILIIINGSGKVLYGQHQLLLTKGEALVIPASINRYTLSTEQSLDCLFITLPR